MKYEIIKRASFKRGVKRAAKRGLDLSLLESVILLLASGVPLPADFKDHPLKGARTGQRECHVDGKKGDWLLVYRKIDDALLLYLVDTGTHDELFGK